MKEDYATWNQFILSRTLCFLVEVLCKFTEPLLNYCGLVLIRRGKEKGRNQRGSKSLVKVGNKLGHCEFIPHFFFYSSDSAEGKARLSYYKLRANPGEGVNPHTWLSCFAYVKGSGLSAVQKCWAELGQKPTVSNISNDHCRRSKLKTKPGR